MYLSAHACLMDFQETKCIQIEKEFARITKLKIHQIKIYSILEEITKFNPV